MSRWRNNTNPDHGRLPSGMIRIGYDADAQQYTYRAKDGSIWQGAPGYEFGTLSLVTPAPPKRAGDEGEKEEEMGLVNVEDPDSPERRAMMFAPSTLGAEENEEWPPAPAYRRRSRQFTDFDQISGAKRKSEQKSSLVRRTMSMRKPAKSKYAPSTLTSAAAEVQPAPLNVALEPSKEAEPMPGSGKDSVFSRMKRTISVKRQAATATLQRRGTL